VFDLKYCDSKSQIADLFTKGLIGPSLREQSILQDEKGAAERWRCKYCRSTFQVRNGTNRSLRRNLKSNHQNKVNKGDSNYSEPGLGFARFLQSYGNGALMNFSEKNLQILLQRICVVNDLPYSFVDWLRLGTVIAHRTEFKKQLNFLHRRLKSKTTSNRTQGNAFQALNTVLSGFAYGTNKVSGSSSTKVFAYILRVPNTRQHPPRGSIRSSLERPYSS
jgi:hypothetical protein